MPADGGRRDAEQRGEFRRGLRTALEEQGAHAVARSPVVGASRRTGGHSAFHNTIVTYFDDAATKAALTSGARVTSLTPRATS